MRQRSGARRKRNGEGEALEPFRRRLALFD
jgi:hypothetical protein